MNTPRCCQLSATLSLLCCAATGASLLAQTTTTPAEASATTQQLERLDKIVVTPSRFGVGSSSPELRASLSRSELDLLPQTGEDLFRAISRMPGLSSYDYSAAFWVRGAPNDQVLLRYDGVDLIEPYHMKDFDNALSIVDVSSVARLDLATGGFTADFGNRLAGVFQIESTSPTQPGYSGQLGISLNCLRASAQGSFDDGKGTFSVGARRGYPDLLIKWLSIDENVRPRYYDVSLKSEYRLNPAHKVSVHVLGAFDSMLFDDDAQPRLRSRYTSGTYWGRWQANFGDKLHGDTVASRARLTWERLGDGLLERRYALALTDKRQLDDYSVRQDWTFEAADSWLLRAGWNVSTQDASYDYDYSRELPVIVNGVQTTTKELRNAHLRPDATQWGVFLAPRWRPINALTLEAGVRLEHFGQSNETLTNPRLHAAWKLGKGTLRAAWGRYAQAQGLHQIAVADADTRLYPAEQAEHRVLGYEQTLGRSLQLRVEAYERLETHLRPRYLNLVDAFEIYPEAQTDRAKLTPSDGKARGVELMLQSRLNDRLSWTASYALARATDRISTRDVPRSHDQRHTVALTGSYAFSKQWQFIAAWQLHSGWPTTDLVMNSVTLANGKKTIVRNLGPAFADQLPYYHRLDLRLTRFMPLRHGMLRFYFDIFNAYSHRNILGYNTSASFVGTDIVVRRSTDKLLPIIPSAGASWEF